MVIDYYIYFKYVYVWRKCLEEYCVYVDFKLVVIDSCGKSLERDLVFRFCFLFGLVDL